MIASNLTNEYATGWYYFKLYLGRMLGKNMLNEIVSTIEPQIQSIIDSLGGISDIDTAYSVVTNFTKILFRI
ncbi:hypothetical protein [Clostridium sp. ZBS18]|uniref:hypothetical protein n=1 Tax=Clostridium sp. ZBS18 TaxID=2949967 RepID=UPI00207942EF|nr:hypothetical protein [Clostridium sp. ZBS18]